MRRIHLRWYAAYRVVRAMRSSVASASGSVVSSASPSALAAVFEILYLDPLLCDVLNDDFTLCADSPCLPGSPENLWGELVGAYGQGCGTCGTALPTGSWGGIKALYR